MNYQISGFKPEKLFHFFEDISAIPRGSGNEKAICKYLVEFAEKRELEVYHDDLSNVIIKKNGSLGAEKLPPVMLQGHTDMVCEKLADINHDFEKDALKLIVKDNILTAKGSTLGADNGVAVSLMLTVLDSKDLKHPPLECVFTSQEEIGLNGAAFLKKSLIKSRTMINMDSEEEGVATVSCAGGLKIEFSKSITRESLTGMPLSINMFGLLGGHSGMDINKERQNACILMARMLHRLLSNTDGSLISFAGGFKDNAIPRECEAMILYPSHGDLLKAEQIAKDIALELSEEILPHEPDFRCTISTGSQTSMPVISKSDSSSLISAIYLAPNGVLNRNMNMDGFVVASSNLGIVRIDESSVTMVFSPRSSSQSIQLNTKSRLALLAETFGFQMNMSGEYPGWSYKEHSPIREVFEESYKRLFKKPLKIEAIHAGLECGLFSDALPGLDAIAVGPTITGCHTPNEALSLDSFERFYLLIKDVLERLAK